jgi:hypothetical protein
LPAILAIVVAVHESACGTFQTCAVRLTMSVQRGRPEVSDARSE